MTRGLVFCDVTCVGRGVAGEGLAAAWVVDPIGQEVLGVRCWAVAKVVRQAPAQVCVCVSDERFTHEKAVPLREYRLASIQLCSDVALRLRPYRTGCRPIYPIGFGTWPIRQVPATPSRQSRR